MKRAGSILVAALACGLVACTQPSWLAGQEHVGDKEVNYIVKLAGADGDGGQLYNFYIRVCDYDAGGHPVRCADSLILSNVALGR